ncbi:MAG: hypothetical protein WCL02_00470 [bacterium]
MTQIINMLQPITTIIGFLAIIVGIVYGSIKIAKYLLSYSAKQKEKKEFNQQHQNAKDCLAQLEKKYEETARLIKDSSGDDISSLSKYHKVLGQIIKQVREVVDFYSSMNNLLIRLNIDKKDRNFLEEMAITDSQTIIKTNHGIIAKNLKDLEALMHKDAPVH